LKDGLGEKKENLVGSSENTNTNNLHGEWERFEEKITPVTRSA
jgi:hypothetical protein